jgi:GT2 family glycosyltransferase/glycosyltransferase involved in cell wall biosynthesis
MSATPSRRLGDDGRCPRTRAGHCVAAIMNGILDILKELRPRHARVALLGFTVALSELAFGALISRNRQKHTPPGLDWGRGLTVIVPHHSGAELLGQCLTSLHWALCRVTEPNEIIVVVNGSTRQPYAQLQAEHPTVRWLFFPEPLGFTGAVLKGIAEARHGSIYLLNDDMLLEPEALAESLSWREPRVFGIASQIFFWDEVRRREETGWTEMHFDGSLPMPRHEPPPGPAARGTVWAGAGSALFHAGMLRDLMPSCKPFDPFYWEDVDLGVRAWRLGYESLVCATSVAWHKHRATVERIYPREEVNRIFERNRLLFQLRNPFPLRPLRDTLRHIARLDAKTRDELGSWRHCADLWRTRWRAFRAPNRDLDYPQMWQRVYPRPRRPAVVVASPFAVLPPVHGGAMRTYRLASELARDFDVVLVSDEAALYPQLGQRDDAPFAVVRLVSNRPTEPAGQEANRIARIHSHSHAAFARELGRVIDLYHPAAVVVEHIELGALIDLACVHRPKFVLDLHDVLLRPREPSQADADAFELTLMRRYDGLVVSSAEDRALLGDCDCVVVPNGCDPAIAARYAPSRGLRSILFVGPFRAPINWQGIVGFAERVYPRIEAGVQGVSLTIVGGKGAQEACAGLACFSRPSITVVDTVEDLAPLLRTCALTINPQSGLRGSSVKVVESLAAGRVCVSTRDGARGWINSGFRSLVVVDDDADFAARIMELLGDEERRVALEVPPPDLLVACSWEAAGERLRTYLHRIIRSGETSPP